MDPASFAASILTLLAAAGATSEYVYNFMLDIEEIPDEIRSHAIKLQCLHQAISSLMNLYRVNASVAEFQLDPFFAGHLQSFQVEIHELEVRLRASSAKLNGSRKEHFLVRLKWLSSDRHLRKFYGKLDDWLKIFLTTVHTTELSVIYTSRLTLVDR